MIFPPWINKFYIMDLKPQNKPDQMDRRSGLTLFVVAWKTPMKAMPIPAWTISPSYVEVMDRVLDPDRPGQAERRRLLHRRHHAVPDAVAAQQRGDDRMNSATFLAPR